MKVRKARKVQIALLGFLIGIAALVITGCPMELNTNIGPGTSTIKGITAGDPGTVTVTVTVEVEVPGTPPPPITIEVPVPGENITFDLNRIFIVNRSSTATTAGKVTTVGTAKATDIPIIPADSFHMLTLNAGDIPVTTQYQISIPSHSISTTPFTMPPDKVLIIGDGGYTIDDGDTVIPGVNNGKPYLVVYNMLSAPAITSIDANVSADDTSFGTEIDDSAISPGEKKIWEVPLGAVRQYRLNGATPPNIWPENGKHTFTYYPYLIVASNTGSSGGQVDNIPPPPVPVDGVKVSATDTSITVLITASPPSDPDFNGWMVWLNDGSSYHIAKDASPRQVVISPLTAGLYSVAVSTIDTTGNISHPQTYPILVGSGTGGDHDPIIPEADDDQPNHPPGSGMVYVRVINQSTHPVTNVQYGKAVTGPWLEFKTHPVAISVSESKLFALKPASYSFLISGFTWNPTPLRALANGKEYVIIVRDTGDPQIIDPDGDEYPIIPMLLADQPDNPLDSATHARVRVINQSTLYNATNVKYNGGKTFIGNPIEVNKGKQKLLAVKAGSYSFEFTGGPPWNPVPTPAKTLKVNREYIIILNDTEDPIFIDPDDPGTGGPEDPVIPVDPPYRPGAGGVTFISVINNSTHPVTNVQFKASDTPSVLRNFVGNPIPVATGTQKLFAMKPGDYSFKFTGHTWTETAMSTFADGKIYLIVLSDDPPPVIIDPADPGTGLIIPTLPADQPIHGNAATYISVINRSETYDVINVRYNTGKTFIGSPNPTDPITIGKNRQKLFMMEPGNYVFNISSNPGGRWNPTPSKQYKTGKTYIIILTDNADPEIIDPEDPEPGIIIPVEPPLQPPATNMGKLVVVNEAITFDITRTQFNNAVSDPHEFQSPSSVYRGQAKMFGLKGGATPTTSVTYTLIFTKSTTGTLTTIPIQLKHGDLKYVIVKEGEIIIVDPEEPPPTDTTPPGVPEWKAAANITSTSVVLNWQNPTGSGIYDYLYVELKIVNLTGGAGYGTLPASVAIIKPGTTATVGSLTPGSTYAFQIRAVDEYGNASAWVGATALSSNGTNVITTLPAGAVLYPPLVGLKVIQWNTDYINIQWTSPAMTPPVAGGSWPKPEFSISPNQGAHDHVTANAASFTGLTNNTFYTIGMRLKYEDGTYCDWQYVTQTTSDKTAPQPPSNVWATRVTNSSLQLGWTNSADTDVAKIGIMIWGPTDSTISSQISWTCVINAYTGAVTSSPATSNTVPRVAGAAQVYNVPAEVVANLLSDKNYYFAIDFTDDNGNYCSSPTYSFGHPSGTWYQ